MKITAIIPSFFERDSEYLKVCVESLRASQPNWDIIVVTNGSKHKPDLRHIFGITIHIHLPSQGQCQAVNCAAQLVNPETKYIFVSNSDMYYAPNWADNLRFDHLCFSPNLVEPTNNKGSAPPFIKFDGGFTLEEFKKEAVDEFIKEEMAVKADTGGIGEEEGGFNLPFFVRLDLWRTVGGYDTEYDPWGSNSDTDLQTAVELAGVRTRRLRDVLVYHFSNKTGTFEGDHKKEWQHNWDYFTKKWGFNRDDLGSDVWYSKDLISEDLLRFKPEWKGKYDGDS